MDYPLIMMIIVHVCKHKWALTGELRKYTVYNILDLLAPTVGLGKTFQRPSSAFNQLIILLQCGSIEGVAQLYEASSEPLEKNIEQHQ